MDGHAIAGREAALHHQIDEGREERFGNARRCHEIERGRRGEHLPARCRDVLGVPSAREQRAHPLVGARQRPRDLEPEDLRFSGRGGIASRDLREVGAVEPRRCHPHEYFVSPGLRHRRLPQLAEIAAVALCHMQVFHDAFA